ncbi:MAG: hypothetical protein ACXITR_06590 [Cyanobacterium sp.]
MTLQLSFLDKENQPLTSEDYARQEDKMRIQLQSLSRLPSLGFDNLIANGVFLNFIQYYGDTEARQITGYSVIPDFFELVVSRDPRFVNGYLIMDPANTLFAGKPQLSVKLLENGLNYLNPQIPQSHQLWIYKAINELLFLGQTEDALESYKMAAQWAREQNTEISIAQAQRAEETAEFLANNPNSKLARGSSWLMILNNTRDEEVRNIALTELQNLGAQIIVDNNRVSIIMPDE